MSIFTKADIEIEKQMVSYAPWTMPTTIQIMTDMDTSAKK